MPRKPAADMSVEFLLETASRLALFVMSEKGGVWKSALVSRIVPYLEAAGRTVGVVQVDQQKQLEKIFGDRVVSIAMPDADTLRKDDTADAIALIPLYDTLVDQSFDAVVVDVGANLDQRVFAFMATTALHEVLAAERRTLVGLVPMRPDEDAVNLGCRTMARFPLALPGIRVLPVLCAESEAAFHTLRDDVQDLFDRTVGPYRAAGETLLFPRLPPRAVQELGRSGLTASAYANLDPATLIRTTGYHPAIARQLQGDLIEHVAALDGEFGRLFGSFRGAGTADRAAAP